MCTHMDTHAQAHTRAHTCTHTSSQAEGRSMCSLPGERPRQIRAWAFWNHCHNQGFSHHLMSADSRGIVPHARNSILPGPLSVHTADAHLPKWEPLFGEGGGGERGGGERGGSGEGAQPGLHHFPVLFPQTCSIIGLTRVQRSPLLNVNALLHV